MGSAVSATKSGSGSGSSGSGARLDAGGAGSGAVSTAPDAGLRSRLDAALAVLGGVVSELDPGCLTGGDATVLYGCFAGFERLSVAGKTLLAPRIEASGTWRDTGHANAATMLASLEGVSAGQAKHTLTIGRRLDQLPGTEDAVRRGTLSAPKLHELTGAGVLDPSREPELLDGSADQPLHLVKERCRRSRATSRSIDPLATLKAIRASRHFSSWTDPDGAFCYQGRDTADRGAQILSHLGQMATRLRRAHRVTGEETSESEPESAVRADAFFALLTRRQLDPSKPGGDPGPDPVTDHADEHDPDPHDRDPLGAASVKGTGDDSGDGTGAEGPSADSLAIIDRSPTCSVVVRVDLAALLRGHAIEGELCEIDDQGPIPVRMARDMANDSFLKLVFHQAGDIKAVSHLGRTINRTLRTALVHRDRTCVVPGCGVSFGLEIDHLVPFADNGPTELDNLALLCNHHHYLKTYEDWSLTRVATKDDGSPRWRFERPPPFGQEPGLGIDTLKETWP